MYRYSEVNPNGDPVVREGYAGDHNLWRIQPIKVDGTWVSPPIALLGWRLDATTSMYALDVKDDDGLVVSSQSSKDRPLAPRVISMIGKPLMLQARRYVEMHACNFFVTQQTDV